MSFITNKRIKQTSTGSGDISLQVKIKRQCEFENSWSYDVCRWIRHIIFFISLFAVVILYLYAWKSIIAIILYVLILLIQVLFYIPAIIRQRKVSAHEKKYKGKKYANDPVIIDRLSELYLKESKTLISLLYQFFYGIKWTKTGSSDDYFKQHMRAVHWSLYVRIYWFCIFVGATLTISLVVYMNMKDIGVAAIIFIVPTIVFVTIFLIDINCYKNNLKQVKILSEKYNKSPSIKNMDELKLYSDNCRTSIVWGILDFVSEVWDACRPWR